MGAIEAAVQQGSRLTRVRRREAGTRGSDGRFTPGDETVASVLLFVQPLSRKLAREIFGDSTTGGVEIWASKTYLAAAFEEGDADEVPLNWEGLQVAPAENTSGPPGDRIEWNDRIYEVTNEDIWDDAGLVSDSQYRAYAAAERGPV
jgi:hypothetical protein